VHSTVAYFACGSPTAPLVLLLLSAVDLAAKVLAIPRDSVSASSVASQRGDFIGTAAAGSTECSDRQQSPRGQGLQRGRRDVLAGKDVHERMSVLASQGVEMGGESS
jgi:hypothetical protein